MNKSRVSALRWALAVVCPLSFPSPALAADPPKQTDIEVDVTPAPPAFPPAPPPEPPPPAKPLRDQPPTPAHPHTELESGPPTKDQADQWPVVPQKDGDAQVPTLTAPIIRPYVSLVGGATADFPIQYKIGNQPASNFADRVSTIMISDFGVRGALLPWVSFESELMANGGVSLHGTSAFEGQAALQVRKQVLHLAKDWWTIEVGRIVDEASVDYFSYHIADCFLMDPATEPFLLFDGFNLGNGVRATAELFKGFRLGFNFNAGNPTSSSAIFAFGGSFPPYSNIFSQQAASVPISATNYPDDSEQAYTFTPSAMYKNKYFEAKTELQYFLINTDAEDGKSPTPTLHGYNYRASAALHLWDDLVMPFGNFNYAENDTVTSTGGISTNRYVGVGFSGGLDVNYQKKWGNYNGFGAMFAQDESEQDGSGGIILRNRYYNVGTTYWLAPMVALGARYAEYTNEELNQVVNKANPNPVASTGVRTVLLTLRLVL